MGRKVKIASATLNQWVLDFEGNRDRILESIMIAKEAGATIRTGPELEVSGYSCEDHFYESDTYLHSWEVIGELLSASLCKDIMIDVGMPVRHKNVAYNCRLIFLNKKILLIRPKLIMCDDGAYRESRWFTGWKKKKQLEDYFLPDFIYKITGQETVPFGDAVIVTKETIIGYEICEELWNPQSTFIELALDGVEIIFNSSGSYTELRKCDVAKVLVKNASAKGSCCYVYTNMRGGDGQRIYFGGGSTIAVNGTIVSKAKQYSMQEIEVITAVIDLEDIRSNKLAFRSLCQQAHRDQAYPRIVVDFSLSPSDRNFGRLSVECDDHCLTPEEEIAQGPACWLWDYLRRSGQGGFFLPLSGGLDSSSVAVIVYSMCKMLLDSINGGDTKMLADLRRILVDPEYKPTKPQELCNRLLVTCYMGTENSSKETKNRAASLAAAIGSYHLTIGIDRVICAVIELFSGVTGLFPKFSSQGGCPRQNLALQNIQARLRMVLSYLFAQLMLWARGRPGGLLVLGSANVDEALRGYMTKYDCSSADINPIGGICKRDLKLFLNYAKVHLNIPIIEEIVNAPPTAELEPLKKGQIAQTDEEDMGMTYDELNLYGRLRKLDRCGPYSMYCKLVDLWPEQSPKQLSEKVKHFFRCYAINRHKMTILTPSYHAAAYSPDDNRFDHRPFLYRVNWSWQFRAIDNEVDDKNTSSKRVYPLDSSALRDSEKRHRHKPKENSDHKQRPVDGIQV